MSVKLDALNVALAGKAIERGLDAAVDDGQVTINYNGDSNAEDDHLHKQAMRNLVARLMPGASTHIKTLDNGFQVSVEIPTPVDYSKKEVTETDFTWIEGLTDAQRLDLIRRVVAA